MAVPGGVSFLPWGERALFGPVGPPGGLKSPDKFELTTDYIQQTIQQPLLKDNLSPEIEQKLLALQQHNQDHDPPPVS